MSIEKKEDWQLLEQLLDEAFFSDRFRRRTASFVLPPFAVGALHFASGCAGMNAFWESAGSASAGARPVLLSTNTMSSTAAISFVANRWEG